MPVGQETPPARDRQTTSQTQVLRQRRVNVPAKSADRDSEEMVPRITQETMSKGVAVEEEEEMILLQDVKSDDRTSGTNRTDGTNKTNGLHLPNGGEVLVEVNRTENKSDLCEDDGDEIVEETSLSQPLLSPKERLSDDGGAGDGEGDTETVVPTESSFMIGAQVFLPFLIAGFGTVGAGLVLDIVQHWPVFKEVTEVFILVPALLGLKGNLEMTLASRLSTAANLGGMDEKKEQWKMIGGNMALTQCQAIVVGFLASLAAVIFGWIPDGEFNIHHVMLLCASSLVTASLASGLLGSIMVAVILLSKKCNINPDNVATPIAASLGDLITLALLSWISNILYQAIGKQHWLAPSIIIAFLLFAPLWAYLSHHNRYTHDVLYSGWSPVIIAMMISSVGGLVLDIAIRQNAGVAVFSPVINGVGGNLVAVQSSRLSTSLHKHCAPCTLPADRKGTCKHPFRVFFAKDQHSRSARVLFLMVIPGQLIFLYFISYVKAGHTSITLRVTFMYLIVAMLQVGTLLAIADWLVHLLWKKGKDPDNFSIPYLTAIGDLLGTSLLALGFYVTWLLGDRDSDVGD